MWGCMRSVRFPRWVPYIALGPITGPLARRLYDAMEARRPVLAAVYGLGIVEVLLALPLAFLEMLARLH